MKLRGAIFDFDGTLFESMSIWETAGRDYLCSIGYQPKNDLQHILAPMSLLQAANYMKDEYAIPLTVDEIIKGINQTVENFYFHQACPKASVKLFLEEFQRKGVRMCIATATDRYQIEVALKRCEMEHFFLEIFTCSSIGHGKDEPHIFEAALKFLGTEKGETFVFEDGYHAAKTAKMASFPVVGVYDKYEKRGRELHSIVDFFLTDYCNPEVFWECVKLKGGEKW